MFLTNSGLFNVHYILLQLYRQCVLVKLFGSTTLFPVESSFNADLYYSWSNEGIL